LKKSARHCERIEAPSSEKIDCFVRRSAMTAANTGAYLTITGFSANQLESFKRTIF